MLVKGEVLAGSDGAASSQTIGCVEGEIPSSDGITRVDLEEEPTVLARPCEPVLAEPSTYVTSFAPLFRPR
jgi:hypothetical protein